MLLTICALFPTLVHAASAEERPVEVNSEQKQAPPPEAKPEVKPVEKEAPLATTPNIQERSPKLSVKPIADPPMTRSLPTGENKTGVSSQSISVPKGPGTIEGMGESFSAQASTGIASFSVPFALPAARGDAQPSLSLSYSSASGSGVAGVGWDVGVPFIARETDRGLPQYDDKPGWHANQDRFVYNGGQELVPIAEPLAGEVLPTWAGAGWQYFRPRVEGSYLRFFWNPSLRLWRVQDKGGVILELGVVGTEADAIETDPAGTKVFRWNLKRQLDPHGNEVRYYYDRLEGNVRYLTDILYTQPPGMLSGIARSAWAYQVHLEYVDRTDVTRSYRRGWETIQGLRLSTVTVSAKDNDPIGERRLVRSYGLSYLQHSHLSLLSSVQAEGRCGEAQPGERCALPKMRFRYTHVEVDANDEPVFADGFEVINESVTAIASSPKHSVNEDYTDLYDVNSDGLPDVVTMMPGLYNHEHGLWIQGQGGHADRFGPLQYMGLKAVLGATASQITKHNPNLVSLDLNGDATIDLLHMPKVKTYSVYTPLFEANKWWWDGRKIETADDLDARIDFSGDADDIRVFDVNGDGLVDVVKTAGTALQVWFSLGRYPGGDGRFGSATWTGPDTADLSMAPVLRCLPWSSTPIRFSDSDIKLGDMNGDGLTDIVRVRKGDIKYWPGRGDGTFGTGALGCEGGTFGQDTYVQMAESPWFSDPDGSGLRIDDVNGDGVADLVQIRFQDVDIWYNHGGASWGQKRWLHGTPVSPSYQNRVRIVDMNGSGTSDILWGDGHAYKYIDLSKGTRPWLLRRVDNGMGSTTEISYATTTSQMLAAAAQNKPWEKLSPVVHHVVERVTVRDNLGKIGRPPGVYVTDYTYRDPVYDGIQREFRGFSSTKVTSVGDDNSPTSVSESRFLLGERPVTGPYNDGLDLTDEANDWVDNPHEALKGLPAIAETYAPDTGVYLSSNATTYALRKLYEGTDGRGVFVAFAKQTDVWLYDTAGFQAVAQPPLAPLVPQLRAPQYADAVFAPRFSPRAVVGTKHVPGDVTVDLFGNRLTQTAYGAAGNEAITTHTSPQRVDQSGHVLGEGGWAWRTTLSWITGNQNPGERGKSETFYDTRGDPIETRAYLKGVGSLTRAIPSSWPADAPAPGFEGWITTSQTQYDSYGNAVFTAGPNGRCAAFTYDPLFEQLPGVEVVYVGEGTQTIHGHSCGDRELAATALYDRGWQAPLQVVDINNAKTTVEYDVLGRIRKIYQPRPDPTSTTLPLPSMLIEYQLPDDEGNPPYSRLVTYAQDGATEDEAAYHVTHAFVDGLGRTIATLSEADEGDDGFRWIVEGLTDYDAKGAERRKYLAWSWNGADPATYPLSAPAESKYGRQRYDAFGRAIQTFGLDGTVTLHTRYHALSADAWDAEDLGPGPHQGTFASEVKDGHGRVVRTTSRAKPQKGQPIEERHVDVTYLPSGEPETITQRRGGGGGSDSVTRSMGYDSLGRMTENTDVNTGTWRYVYNDASDLVGTSDARGCGVNFHYDAAGRILGEDYVPCGEHQAPFSPNIFEVAYRYDEPDPDALAFESCEHNSLKGRLASVTDRAGKVMSCYDHRGRTTEAARRLAAPDGTLTEPWFHRHAAYDAADRSTTESTGAQVNVPSGVTSAVTTHYNERGAVRQVTSTYGTLVDAIKRDADGLVKEVRYGDGASTTTGYAYDDLRRLRNLTTYRANVSGWTNADKTQQMLLQDEQITYDRVGNPVEIRDWRTPSEWPEGAKPVTRKMAYDDLYRLVRIDYQYAAGADPWTDPYDAPQDVGAMPRRENSHRPMRQTYAYDWLGNTQQTDDDAQAFFDRSLGDITNNTYQLQKAEGADGQLETSYDASGNLVALTVERQATCVGGAPCPVMHFVYEWDEVGRLMRARRWDFSNWQTVPPPSNAQAELSFTYDANDQRVRKTSGDLHTLYIFGSLELRRAAYDPVENVYQLDSSTEVPYLQAHGVRLARVVHQDPPDDYVGQPSVRVFLELGDHLGSTSVVLDHATGELVERSTAYAYGAVESDYRPEKWGKFREDYRFTGKEDDVEVGLIYFGKRYYAPLLGRWISADPLAVHAPGEADLNLYAYVRGKALIAVDPVGLQEAVNGASGGPPAPGVTAPGTQGEVVTLPEVEIIVDVKTPTAAPGGAHATPQETGALTQQGISQGGGKDAYQAWAAGLYGAAWMYCQMAAFEDHGPDAFFMTEEALQNADALRRAENTIQIGGKDVELEVVKGQVPIGPKTNPVVRMGRYQVGPHGRMPSPRPNNRESHHGVMSEWFERQSAGVYKRDAAPAVLMSERQHAITKGIYNRWRAQKAAQHGGIFDWDKVSYKEMRSLSDKMFKAAGTPAGVQQEYYRQLAIFKATLK
jgi:RHS repeat-associated protein